MTKSVSRNTKKLTKASPADDKTLDFVLPERAVELLHAYRDGEDSQQWALGDLAVALRAKLCKRRGDWIRLCRRLAIEASCDESTVRDRHNMAQFFDGSREEFSVLSFHQLRACRSAGDAWRTYAERAITSADDYAGKPAPVNVIRAWIREDRKSASDKEDELPRWEQLLTSIIEMCDAIRRMDDAPETARDAARLAAGEAVNGLPGLSGEDVGEVTTKD